MLPPHPRPIGPEPAALDRLADPWSRITTRLTLSRGDLELGTATGFYWRHGGRTWLITNWHVVTGRNADDGQPLHPGGGLPDRLAYQLRPRHGGLEVLTVTMALGPANGWMIHPEHGRGVDVVAVPIINQPGWEGRALNDLVQHNAAIEVGREAYVLGYPFFDTPAGLPVWKRASIATEPGVMHQDREYHLIDTASRKGMSGAPVIVRGWDGGKLDNGDRVVGGDITRFLGVYAGRFGVDGLGDVQLGRVWPIWTIPAILGGGRWEGVDNVAW